MLVVKIEFHKFSTGDVEEIGRMYIANVGSGNQLRGDYEAAVCRRGSTKAPIPINPVGPKATRIGSVKNYPRLSYNVWRLVCKALKSCFPEEAR